MWDDSGESTNEDPHERSTDPYEPVAQFEDQYVDDSDENSDVESISLLAHDQNQYPDKESVADIDDEDGSILNFPSK